MTLAALVAWVATAVPGVVLLAVWDAGHGRHSPPATVPFPSWLVASHVLLASAGLAIWSAGAVTGGEVVGWVGAAVLAAVVAAGSAMVVRGLGASPRPGPRFPVPVVVLHGVLAALTIALVTVALLDR